MVLLTVALLLFHAGGSESGDNPNGVSRPLNRVTDDVLARHKRIERLFAEMYMTTTIDGRSRTDRTAVAFAIHQRFIDFMHFTGPGNPPWRDNARFQFWLSPNRAIRYMPFGSVLHEGPMSPRIQTYWESPYTLAIGWRPDTEFCSEANQRLYLDHLLSSSEIGKLRINESAEKSGPYRCVMMESKNDQLWIVPDLGFAIVKRVHVSPDGFTRTYWFREFKEAANALWLPWQVTYQASKNVNGKQVLLRTVRLDIQKLAINETVSDAVFEFSPQPGMLTVNDENEPIGHEPGGEDLLDLWAAVCADVFPPYPANISSVWSARASQATSAIALLTIAYLMLRTRIKSP
jgi:hypothetical protein